MVTNILSVSEGMVTDDGTARAKFHVVPNTSSRSDPHPRCSIVLSHR